MLKGIIFDLDGTLIDTIDDIGLSTNLALESLGYPTYDLAEYKQMVGNGFRKLCERALPEGVSEEEVDKAYAGFVENYDKHYMDKSHPYDGIKELLRRLNEANIMIGVNSNKRDDYTHSLIKHLFSDITFKKVVGQIDGVPAKPAPDGALMILKEMGIKKEDVIFVGDTKVDIATGKNTGLKTIGCLWGFRDLKELEEAGADYIVKDPSEIFDIVTKWISVWSR